MKSYSAKNTRKINFQEPPKYCSCFAWIISGEKVVVYKFQVHSCTHIISSVKEKSLSVVTSWIQLSYLHIMYDLVPLFFLLTGCTHSKTSYEKLTGDIIMIFMRHIAPNWVDIKAVNQSVPGKKQIGFLFAGKPCDKNVGQLYTQRTSYINETFRKKNYYILLHNNDILMRDLTNWMETNAQILEQQKNKIEFVSSTSHEKHHIWCVCVC